MRFPGGCGPWEVVILCDWWKDRLRELIALTRLPLVQCIAGADLGQGILVRNCAQIWVAGDDAFKCLVLLKLRAGGAPVQTHEVYLPLVVGIATQLASLVVKGDWQQLGPAVHYPVECSSILERILHVYHFGEAEIGPPILQELGLRIRDWQRVKDRSRRQLLEALVLRKELVEARLNLHAHVTAAEDFLTTAAVLLPLLATSLDPLQEGQPDALREALPEPSVGDPLPLL